MKIFYNTSTGNSLYVAKMIKESFKDCELVSMSKALKENKFDICEDIIGFVYPIHCSGLPIVVNEFISKLKINKDVYIFAIGVSGGGGANTSFIQINKLLKSNIKISNYCTIRYISNYMRAGRNPTKARAEETIKENESKIVDFIESVKRRDTKEINFKAGIGNLAYKIWKDFYKNKDKNFNVNEKCISCNMCKKVCPVDNIVMENNRPKWLGKCTDCMACINICPKEAINIGKSTIKKNRYLNPYIKREELI
ncbi:EFR1 family ferrodoxin [Clostridium beijerinckii]|uniref:4Fe-4S binding protein n=1 Tax=Clostridium beijerinckii TaxID=1520 RepID=A0A7X9XMG0_CLOBE|nr:EFR1 family ferrodoxin [Clostridium beijerinckii]NMF03377.1 4Fe-4S binding protein [Clostridium beijerinckii]